MYWILDRNNTVLEYVETLKEARELFSDFYKRNGYRIEKARNFYEVGLMNHVEGSVDDDFETAEFCEADTYDEAVKIAKQQSKTWDACDVICYTWTDDTMYQEVFKEQYVKGKKQWRMDCGL